jgi:MFS family permease
MGKVVSNSWALLLGMLLLMVGNGLQGTLLGIRGEIEGFSTSSMSLVMSAYFMGFLGGSRLAHPVSDVGQPVYLGGREIGDRVLFFGGVCHSRKLAE